jgi:hypothetical protein
MIIISSVLYSCCNALIIAEQPCHLLKVAKKRRFAAEPFDQLANAEFCNYETGKRQ